MAVRVFPWRTESTEAVLRSQPTAAPDGRFRRAPGSITLFFSWCLYVGIYNVVFY